MLFAPLATSGGAMAAAPADHHQMMEKDHCGGEPSQDQDKSTDMSCCAAMCMAVAVDPASAAEQLDLSPAIQRPSVADSPHSYLAELPTPPPRVA
jgi:hypothetical protein